MEEDQAQKNLNCKGL
ncbi:unnamed protein product [Lathyrus oleraceus]